jgi:hypothetical protein
MPTAALLGFLIIAVGLSSADTIYLKNSDRVTRKMERLEDGTLYLSTDHVMHVESANGMRSAGTVWEARSCWKSERGTAGPFT